jgi:hypothetical protein
MLDEFGGLHKLLETPKIYQTMKIHGTFRRICSTELQGHWRDSEVQEEQDFISQP